MMPRIEELARRPVTRAVVQFPEAAERSNLDLRIIIDQPCIYCFYACQAACGVSAVLASICAQSPRAVRRLTKCL